VTAEQYEEWQAHPGTQEFFEKVNDSIRDITEVLSQTAGLDSAQDRFHAGLVYALREIKDIEFVR